MRGGRPPRAVPLHSGRRTAGTRPANSRTPHRTAPICSRRPAQPAKPEAGRLAFLRVSRRADCGASSTASHLPTPFDRCRRYTPSKRMRREAKGGAQTESIAQMRQNGVTWLSESCASAVCGYRLAAVSEMQAPDRERSVWIWTALRLRARMPPSPSRPLRQWRAALPDEWAISAALGLRGASVTSTLSVLRSRLDHLEPPRRVHEAHHVEEPVVVAEDLALRDLEVPERVHELPRAGLVRGRE